jgi:hypothetical protein
MAQQEVKYCENCQDWQFCEWQVDNEVAGEPLFSLMCCACGYTFDAEQPLITDPKLLPKEQTQLFPQETERFKYFI